MGRPSKGVRNHIRAWRKIRGLTQGSLAEMCDCAVPTISEAERSVSNPSLDLLSRMACALGVKPGWLLDRDPHDPADVWAIAEELRRLSPTERNRAARVIQLLSTEQ